VRFSIRKLFARYINVKHTPRNESDNIPKENRNDKKRPKQLENLHQNISELGRKTGRDTQANPSIASAVCSFCRCEIKANGIRANWKWNLEPNTLLCAECYTNKDNEYKRRINFCKSCQKKLGFIRYNPKPIWRMSGQMCRKCWDSKNISVQNNAKRKK
jgi:hypothetical protein